MIATDCYQLNNPHIHMKGRIYDPTLGRFLQADPFIQAPLNSQNYNRYSYVLNNPMSYTDPSGFFFKKLKKFVKKYWKAAVAIAVSVATYGAASGWAAGWGMTQGFSMTVLGTTQTFVTGLSVGGAVTAGAIAGAAGGFVAGALQTGSLTGALRGAFTGAISGTAGGYANFGSVGGFGDAAKRVAVAAAGGCGAGKASGGSCGKGARLTGMAMALSVSIEKFTQSKPTFKTPSRKSGTYKPSDQYVSNKGYCVICDVADPDANNIGLGVRASDVSHVVGQSTPQTGWLSFNEGSLSSQALAKIPGFNSGAVFHDVLVGTFERNIGMHHWGSTAQTIGGLFVNQATIIPAIGVNYMALGPESYRYYYSNLGE